MTTSSAVWLGVCLESQGSIGTDRLFTGQRLDSTGLYYYGARYYDPAIGRFISPDPVVQDFTNPQTLNRYSYVLNNPLKYTDPSGNYIEIEGIPLEDWDAFESLGLITPEMQAAANEFLALWAEAKQASPQRCSEMEESGVGYLWAGGSKHTGILAFTLRESASSKDYNIHNGQLEYFRFSAGIGVAPGYKP